MFHEFCFSLEMLTGEKTMVKREESGIKVNSKKF